MTAEGILRRLSPQAGERLPTELADDQLIKVREQAPRKRSNYTVTACCG